MKVDRAKALTHELGGQTFYFWSEHCLQTFAADPAEYGSAQTKPIEARVAD